MISAVVRNGPSVSVNINPTTAAALEYIGVLELEKEYPVEAGSVIIREYRKAD